MEPSRASNETAAGPPNAAAGNDLGLRAVRAASAQLLASLACAVVFLILFAWLADEVLEGEVQQFDLRIRMFVHQFASPSLTANMRALTFLGSFAFLSGLFLVFITSSFLVRLRHQAVWLTIVMGGELLLEFTLKSAFQRPRPIPFFEIDVRGYSFPSGHALASFCFYGVLAGLFSPRIRKRWLRLLLWFASAALVIAIGLSRVYLGVHYPSDVIAGYLAATAWVSALLFASRASRAGFRSFR